MPPKKNPKSKSNPTRTEVNLRAAMASGRSAAEEVIVFRAKQRRKLAEIEKKMPARRRGLGAPAWVPAKARGLFGAKKFVGVVIAEGDSWFDYPMQDVSSPR